MPKHEIKVQTVSLGCPKNRVDTERLLGGLGPGLKPVDCPEDADLVLINTCGFIAPAIEESVQAIVAAAQDIAESGGSAKLAVAGCLVSRFGSDLAAELPEVDLWLTTHELDRWPGMVRASLGRKPDEAMPRMVSTGPGWAYLKVGEGCSHKCAFCTIPSIRGPHVSRGLYGLVAEASGLVAGGARELVVVGQDVTAYGSDIGLEDGLRKLVQRLLPLDGLEWLRLMYLYPAGLTDSLLSFLASAGKPFLPYFDVPLQHAHPDVLASMGRPFARDPYKVVERIRSHFDDAILRTTIIVGYPGETDAHFDALCEFVRQARFTHLGVFAYQAEDGTPAAAMEGQVDMAVREERRVRLMEIQAGISADILQDFVGQKLDILVGEPHEEWPGLFTGRAWFQAPEADGVTYVSSDPGRPLAPGQMVGAEIEEAKTYDLVALA